MKVTTKEREECCLIVSCLDTKKWIVCHPRIIDARARTYHTRIRSDQHESWVFSLHLQTFSLMALQFLIFLSVFSFFGDIISLQTFSSVSFNLSYFLSFYSLSNISPHPSFGFLFYLSFFSLLSDYMWFNVETFMSDSLFCV